MRRGTFVTVPWTTLTDTASTTGAAIVAFASTNVDDIILLAVLWAASRANGRPRPWHIWGGQYLGIGVLVAVSLVAALGLTVVPDAWVGLLGLVPIGLGLRGLAQTVRRHPDDGRPQIPAVATGLLSISAVTIANGADNLAVYTPMLRSLDATATGVTIAVFAALVAVWVALGALLSGHRHVVAAIERWGHWIVPVAFVLIGSFIVVESGVIGHLVGRI